MAIPKSYVKNENKCFGPVYVPGETYSFYINFDTPISDPDFANFKLQIFKGAVLMATDFATLQKDVIFNVMYNIYSTFVFPQLVDDTYQFVIYDTVNNVEKCRSNIIQVTSFDYEKNTARVTYRNDENLYNFQYEALPNFVNQFRMPFIRTELQFESDRKQYRNATDRRLRNVKSYLDPLYEVESYYFDDGAHEAASAMYEHSSIKFDDEQFTPKTAYQIETVPDASLTKAKIQMYQQQTLGPMNLLSTNGQRPGGNCRCKDVYDYWLESGHTGTIDDFIEDMRGSNGAALAVSTETPLSFYTDALANDINTFQATENGSYANGQNVVGVDFSTHEVFMYNIGGIWSQQIRQTKGDPGEPAPEPDNIPLPTGNISLVAGDHVFNWILTQNLNITISSVINVVAVGQVFLNGYSLTINGMPITPLDASKYIDLFIWNVDNRTTRLKYADTTIDPPPAFAVEPTHYWRYDEGVTLSGSNVTQWQDTKSAIKFVSGAVKPQFSNGLVFTGTETAVLSAAISQNAPYTYMIHVSFSDFSTLLGADDGDNGALMYLQSAGYARFYPKNGGQRFDSSFTAQLNTGAFLKVGLTFDGTTAKMYINGAFVQDLNMVANVAPKLFNLVNLHGVSVLPFKGTVKSVAIWDSVQNAAQMTQDTNALL